MAAQLERIHVKVRPLAGRTTTSAGLAAAEIVLRGLVLGIAVGIIVMGADSAVGLLAAGILALGATVVGWRS